MENRDSDHFWGILAFWKLVMNPGKTVVVPIFALIVIFAAASVSATSFSSEGHSKKVKKIAVYMAAELSNRRIKTVMVRPFADSKGRETVESKAVTENFIRHLSSARGKVAVRSSGEAEATITGILLRFEKKDKWQLRVRAARSGSNEIITSYTAIFTK